MRGSWKFGSAARVGDGHRELDHGQEGVIGAMGWWAITGFDPMIDDHNLIPPAAWSSLLNWWSLSPVQENQWYPLISHHACSSLKWSVVGRGSWQCGSLIGEALGSRGRGNQIMNNRECSVRWGGRKFLEFIPDGCQKSTSSCCLGPPAELMGHKSYTEGPVVPPYQRPCFGYTLTIWYT